MLVESAVSSLARRLNSLFALSCLLYDSIGCDDGSTPGMPEAVTYQLLQKQEGRK